MIGDKLVASKDFLITVCCNCMRVRTGDGMWVEAADLLAVAPPKILTHTFCMECARKFYPRLAAEYEKKYPLPPN